MQQPAIPPPPAPPTAPALTGFHLPDTNLFGGIRKHLTDLEYSSQLPGGKSPTSGLIVSFVFAALVGLGLSILVQLALLPAAGMVAMTVFFAPLTEEPFKALGMIIVAYLMWKAVPNRRYGAALGAAAGLGFGIAESILYIISLAAANAGGELILIRIIVTPLMHPLWSAFVGIGVFTLAFRKSNQPDVSNQAGFLPLLFLFIGMGNHLIWNSISIGLAGLGIGAIFLNIVIIFPLFAFILRDFLGGHFNFQNFFEPLEKLSTAYPEVPPPPPPPMFETQPAVVREVIREKEILVRVRCTYCGNVYDSTLNRCPFCGASR